MSNELRSAQSTQEDVNFATLESTDEYASYFNQLSVVFRHLQMCYRAENARHQRAANYEAQVVRAFFLRLLHTVQTLRLKYTYQPSHHRSLWVDLTESGFPNAAEISQMSVDILKSKERLRELPSDSILRRQLLDHLIEKGKDSSELLWQLSEQRYLSMLQPGRLFQPFTPGELKLHADSASDGKTRGYTFTWGCYDHKTNRPYIHVMTLEQDSSEPPLHEEGPGHLHFMETIKAEGSRAPDVGVLALSIDDALETIHPKIIKRICIGPMYSTLLLKNRPANPEDPREAPIRDYLKKYARHDLDYMLFFSDEIIFSKRQQLSRSLLSPKGKVREIFSIPETDPDAFARRASVVHHYALMPHRLLQHIEADGREDIPGLANCKRITYDEQGKIYGI